MSRPRHWGSRKCHVYGRLSELCARVARVPRLIVPAARTPLGATSRDGGPTKPTVGRYLAVALILTGLVSVPTAVAADPRIPLTADPVVLPGGDFCADFTSVITFQDFNQYIVRSTTASDGTVTLRIAGRARATVTNQGTGKSVSFNISGPGTLVMNPDGSFSANLAGPNLLWTARANLANFPNVPTISYTTGHVTFGVDPSGQTTSYSLAGGSRQTNVCTVLAS